MLCLGCAELRNKVEELQKFIQLWRFQIIRDVTELAAKPDATQQHVLEILLRYVIFEPDTQGPDLACPESGCGCLANTYQDLQRHYLSHVGYHQPCPFCSKPLERVSQVNSHLPRCNSRNQRDIPEPVKKRKLDAYRELREAQNNKKRRVLALKACDFSMALTPANTELRREPNQASARGMEEPWPKVASTDQARIVLHDPALMSSPNKRSTLFTDTQQEVAPGLRRDFPSHATPPSLTPLVTIAPSLVDNSVAGSTLSSSHGQGRHVAQLSVGAATPLVPNQFFINPLQGLAPGLIDNFVDGRFAPVHLQIPRLEGQAVDVTDNLVTNTMPLDGILPHAGIAPGLIENFVDGTAVTIRDAASCTLYGSIEAVTCHENSCS